MQPVAQASYSGGQALPAPGSATYAQAQQMASAAGGSSAPAGSLSNGSMIATPNAGVTAAQYQSALQAGFAPISSSNLAPTAPITLPNAPSPSGAGISLTAGNTALAAILATAGFTVNPTTGQFQYTPATGNSTASTEQNLYDTKIAAILGTPTPPSEASIYNSLPQTQTVNNDQQTVNNFSAQLAGITSQQNTLNAQTQNQLLSVRGADANNGVTEAVYGGQADEINREAAIQQNSLAIQAYPIQAQLSAAQGNLQLAQQQLDTVFGIYKDDAQAQYTYQTGIINAVLSAANDEETQVLNDQKDALTSNTNQLTTSIADAKSLTADLLASGQSSLAAQVTQITPPQANSSTFAQDLQAYNAKIADLQRQYVPKQTAAEINATNGTTATGLDSSQQTYFDALISNVKDSASAQTALDAVATMKVDNATRQTLINQIYAKIPAASSSSSGVTWWNPTTWFGGGSSSSGAITSGTQISLNGKIYTYKGTGDTSDISNYTAQ